jgi:inorganic pyrophosphatase
MYSTVTDIRQLPRHLLIEIEHFFMSYKKLERKRVKSFGWFGVREARRAITRSQLAFARKAHP